MDEQLQPLTDTPVFHENLIALEVEPVATLPTPVRSSQRKPLITTMDLSATTCRWPFGDPAEPDFHYCGQLPQRNRPYCDTHEAVSSPSNQRKNRS